MMTFKYVIAILVIAILIWQGILLVKDIIKKRKNKKENNTAEK